jgi:hypothetical protein
MVVVALYRGRRLLKADVIEPGKGSTTDVFDRVVWDQELLLHTDERSVNNRQCSQNIPLGPPS